MKQLLFIYNPAAGSVKNKAVLNKAVEFYTSHEYLVTIALVNKLEACVTDGSLDLNKFDTIVCCGGDGSLNLTASFFMNHPEYNNKAFGYIPTGSTNDFAYSLGLKDNIDDNMQVTLKTDKHKPLDIGLFDKSRYFVYVAAFGAFTKVAYATPQKFKNILGHSAYILEGIKSLSELKAYKAKIEIGNFDESGLIAKDETVEGDFILGLITNSSSIGGFKGIITEKADLVDGKFEVTLIKIPDTLEVLKSITTSISTGKLADNPYIITRKASYIRVTSLSDKESEQPKEIAWTLDGEYGGQYTEVDIENKHNALHIIR